MTDSQLSLAGLVTLNIYLLKLSVEHSKLPSKDILQNNSAE
jgi:hypothetical protein